MNEIIWMPLNDNCNYYVTLKHIAFIVGILLGYLIGTIITRFFCKQRNKILLTNPSQDTMHLEDKKHSRENSDVGGTVKSTSNTQTPPTTSKNQSSETGEARKSKEKA